MAINIAKEQRDSLLPPLWVLTLLAFAFVLYLLLALRELLVLLVVAYSIAYLIDPWVRWYEAHRGSRGYGVLTFYIACFFIIAFITIIAVPTLLEEFDAITESIPEQLKSLQANIKPMIFEYTRWLPKTIRQSWFGSNPQDFAPIAVIVEKAPAYIQTFVPRILETAYKALVSGYSITLTIANLILLPILVYYISVDFKNFHRNILLMLPTNKRPLASELSTEINGYVSAFVRGQLTLGCILTVLYMLGLGWFLGLKLWLLLALITGFGNMIPYFGTVCGVVLATIMTILTHGNIYSILWTWGVFLFIQTFNAFFIVPRVIGGSVGLSPLAVIIALFVAGQLFGLLGLFLAIPATAVVRALGKRIHGWVLQRA